MKMISVQSDCCRVLRALLCPWFLALLLLLPESAARAKTFCFDLQYEPQLENLSKYDFTVLDPSAQVDLGLAHRAGKKVLAYISVGEVGGDAWYLAAALAAAQTKAENPDWGSYVMDVSDPAWARFVITRLAKGAVDQGYDGFFLDTVDVIYDLSEADPDHAQSYFDGMTALIKGLKAAYPTKQIITNRGFEIFDQIRPVIDGFLVESMFSTRVDGGFGPQDSQTTYWLNQRLAPVKAAGTPIYVIDYGDPDNLVAAARTAEKIRNLGYNALVMAFLDGNVLASLSASDISGPPPVPPPVVVTAPKNVTVVAGTTVKFAVQATGSGLAYQWQWKGVNVQGANGPSFVLNSVKAAWAGPYTVVVKNAGGSVQTPPAVLSVTQKKPRR